MSDLLKLFSGTSGPEPELVQIYDKVIRRKHLKEFYELNDAVRAGGLVPVYELALFLTEAEYVNEEDYADPERTFRVDLTNVFAPRVEVCRIVQVQESNSESGAMN